MTIETIEVASRQADVPTPSEVWRYRWDITFTWEYRAPGCDALTSHLSVSDPDELAEVILRTSYDPRLQSFHYQRREALDLTDAPRACRSCGETYDTSSSHTWWDSCTCGGHIHYQCRVCGQNQIYPQMAGTCH